MGDEVLAGEGFGLEAVSFGNEAVGVDLGADLEEIQLVLVGQEVEGLAEGEVAAEVLAVVVGV